MDVGHLEMGIAHAVQQAAHAAQPQPAAKAFGAVDPGECFGIIHR